MSKNKQEIFHAVELKPHKAQNFRQVTITKIHSIKWKYLEVQHQQVDIYDYVGYFVIYKPYWFWWKTLMVLFLIYR